MAAYTDTRPDGNTKLILLIFLAAFAFGALLATLRTPVGRIVTDTHAADRHGNEALAIRRCLEQRGPDMVWGKKDDPSVKIFCVNLDQGKGCGRWGALFAQFWPSLVEGCDYRELTSFVPKDGTYRRVVDYLSQFARRLK